MYGNRTPGNRALPRASKRTNERPRDVTNRIRFFPGPATVAEFLCFYFSSRTLFHPIPMILDRDPLGFPPFYLDDDGTLPRGKSETETLLTRIVANQPLLELGNRKRTILFSPNPSLHLSSLSNRRRSGCPPRRKPSFYVFVLLSFSDTLYPQKSNRTEPNEHYRDDRIRRRPGPITPSP